MIPKFRIWSNDLKEMYVQSDLVITLSHSGINIIHFDSFYEFKDYNLMQSTGLHDKNGVEIYEGDVIRIVHPWKNRTHVGEVFKDDYMFNIKEFFFTHFDFPNQAFSEGTGFMEVIGNVHEHPHLLKKENN